MATKRQGKKGDEGADNDNVVGVVDMLSSDKLSPDVIEAELIRIGMIHESLEYIRDVQFTRDPMLTILYDPEKIVQVPPPPPHSIESSELAELSPIKTTVIDELLRSAHDECKRNYGELYEDSELIQETMATLMASKDTHAKQMVLLCLIATEKGLQTQLESHYPRDGGPEARRLGPFLDRVRLEMDETLNTAYVNVPVPTPYNVDNLLMVFLAKLSDAYNA